MKIPKVIKEAVSALFSGTGKVLSGYGKVIGGYIKFAAIASLFLLLLPAAGIIFKISWLIGTYIALSAVLIVIGLILVVPVLTLAKAAVENIAPLKKAMVSLLAFLFWLLAIAIYFFVVPIGSLATALLVIAIFGLMALGYAAFGIRTNPKLAFGLAVIILVLLTLGSFFSRLFPNTQSAVSNGVGLVDKTISSLFTPKPSKVDLKTFPPFDSEGKARVWYYRGKDGSFEFYDRSGYHWTGTPLKEITPEVLDQYMESLAPKPDLTPKKVNLSSYPPFDLVNGKPRVWYYQNSEGNFEFYDKPGFHWSGEALKLITTQVVDEWRKVELKRKKVEEEQRIERERQLQKIAEEERQKAERERELQKQIEADRQEAERANSRLAENVVLTPLPSPPPEPTLTPTQTQIWERTFQVWVDNSQSTEEVSRLIQEVSDSKTTFKVSDQFKSKKGVVGLSMHLINFGRTVSIREVCEYFDSHGLRSATAKEFGFLYAEHADHLGNIKLDQNYEVISALGTSCQEHRYGPVFRNYEWPNLPEENKPYRLDKNSFDKYTRFATVQINADRREAEKAKDHSAENVVLTPLPSPPSEPTLTPTQTLPELQTEHLSEKKTMISNNYLVTLYGCQRLRGSGWSIIKCSFSMTNLLTKERVLHLSVSNHRIIDSLGNEYLSKRLEIGNQYPYDFYPYSSSGFRRLIETRMDLEFDKVGNNISSLSLLEIKFLVVKKSREVRSSSDRWSSASFKEVPIVNE